jgi:7-cyano-7-deazaguanine reductase
MGLNILYQFDLNKGDDTNFPLPSTGNIELLHRQLQKTAADKINEARKERTMTAMEKTVKSSDFDDLTLLGGKTAKPVKQLETFPNHHRGREYLITMETEEFTTLCPLTGQPDFAKISIQYIPDQKILESKSLKLYLWSFRDKGVFHEHVSNEILDDIVSVLEPVFCKVKANFAVRGGISIKIETEYKKLSDSSDLE